MNKFKRIAIIALYIIKFTAIIVFHICKFFLTIIPMLFAELFKLINQRLRFSITFKTTAAYTLIFSTILFLLGIALTCGFGYFLFYQTSQSLDKNCRVITDLIIDNTAFPRDEISNYAKIEGINVTLYDKTGQIIYPSSEPIPGTNDPDRVRISASTSFDENNLYFQAPVKLSHDSGKIEVYRSFAREITYLQWLVTGLGISFLLTIIITLIIGSSTSRKMLKPVDNMTRTARSISAGDLTTRLDPVDSHDELKELTLTFNEMLDRIQDSFEQQNTFVSDASHELRTPISVIQGYADLLQRWGTTEPAVLDESIDAIKSEADYMKGLVEKLLFLARADKKKLRTERAPFPLHELIDEVVKESRLIDSNHTFSSESNDPITFNGDQALIKQALRIFIDNSIKFTPVGGSIRVNSSLTGKRVVITVEDSGIGIAPEDLPYIFNRFYKSDKARNRNGSGAGLGLSIGKWIIEQHKGEIKAESVLHQGTKITIILPV
ncbi:MAG TPA: HAMP domain-containing sensor histidine kinase [Syntrophomonas sp.]|nr:HAMP domain-containing sensor histidine kinase [Syntrophomonas sp.]